VYHPNINSIQKIKTHPKKYKLSLEKKKPLKPTPVAPIKKLDLIIYIYVLMKNE